MTDNDPRRMRPMEIAALLGVVIGSAVVTYALIGGVVRWALS